MAIRNPQPGAGATAAGTHFYVDGAYTGSVADGGLTTPFATIAAAIAVAAAGDVIIIEAGAYVEDLALAAGEDFLLKARVPGSVTITGSMVSTDASCTLEGLNFIDDGAGIALHITGVAADVARLILCQVTSTAGGGVALSHDNTAGTLEMQGCRIIADVANANEALQLESGTIDILESDIVHGSDVAESIVCEGDAALALTMRDCRCTGSVNSEAAVVAGTMQLEGCQVTVGAISAVIVAATCTVQLFDCALTSTDAANDAIDGAGTILQKDLSFLSTADEIAATITATTAADFKSQHGTIAAAGASPQVDTITLPQPYPDANFDVQLTFEATGGAADDVICSVDQGTLATTGCDVVTTSAAAAAIGGNIHWRTDHD